MAKNIRIYVAALTFKRPEFLRELLESFADLDVPSVDAIDVRFLIVDNDPEGSARSVVESYMATMGERHLQYVVEPEPGIPAARNRALDAAMDHGAQLLCFTDDDVRPVRTWLTELLDCHALTQAALVFGPVRFRLRCDVQKWWPQMIASSIIARGKYVERYAAREACRGRVNTGATSNCLIDLLWTHDHRVRFNHEMWESGGSDTLFRETVRRQGGRIAWCERAVVYEQLPADRLTLPYQYRRARSHGMTFELVGRRSHALILRHPVSRMMAGIALMVLPVLGRASFILGLQLLGMGVGIFQARRGLRSTLYSRQQEP